MMADDNSTRRTFFVVKMIFTFGVGTMFLLSIVQLHLTYGYSWLSATLVSIPAGLIYFGFAYFVLRWVKRKLGSGVEQNVNGQST
ncbi:hypothetical protein [Microbispora sp. NBC_01389]|uniref:hypothetical protein n=1 Tax=Microbispora sp. NBC_01389 TaxID=2903584 RepID=UPI0032458B2B